MNLSDLKPADGAKQDSQARGPWSGLRQWQDRGARAQGRAVALGLLVQARLRGRADAAASACAEARVQQHLPHRVRGGQSRSARGGVRRRARRCRPRRSARRVSSTARRRRSRCSAAVRSPRRSRCRRTSSAEKRPRSSRPPAGPPRRSLNSPRADRGNDVIESLKNLFSITDLRNRVLFTLGMLAVYRVGSHIPTPGVNPTALAELAASAAGHDVRLVRHVHGRRALADSDLRAWRDAVYQRVDHPAAPHGGVAVPRAAVEGGRARTPENHAVHALSDARARRRAVAWASPSGSSATRRSPAACRSSTSRAGASACSAC